MISKELTVFEEDALALTQAALEISRAFESKDERCLAGALDRNLKLWVGIRTLVQQADNPLPMPIKDNLIRYSVGIEDGADLIADLRRSLDASEP